MKYIRSFNVYKESIHIDKYQDILESLNIWHDILLSSINAELVDIHDVLKLPKDSNLNIDFLSNSIEFLNSLSSIGLKKSQITNTDDLQTFLNKPCKFILIYDLSSNELENPEFILFQSYNETLKIWEESKLYKIKDDIKKFFDKLTSKTIEIIDNDIKYIYTTSNGNEWLLQNLDVKNDIYLKYFRKDDLQKVINKRNPTFNII